VLLSDDSAAVAKEYGVLGLGGLFAKRWTYYIRADGTIAAIDKDVDVKTAGQDIARKLAELGFAEKP
jgi:peroxiredoxin Q/BCP